MTASDRTKVYGDELVLGNTSFTVADKGVSGDTTLPNGETVDAVNLVSGSTVTSVNDAGENVTEDLGVSLSASTDLDVRDSAYEDNISIASISNSSNGFNQGNYTITYATGDLTITPRAITLTASDRTKVYGDELVLGNTSFTVADKGVSGDTTLRETVDAVNLVSGSTVTSVNDAGENVTEDLGVSLSASTDLDVRDSAYEDNISIASISNSSNGFNQGNYTITYATGDLTITPRAITLTASDRTKVYGDELVLGIHRLRLLIKEFQEIRRFRTERRWMRLTW